MDTDNSRRPDRVGLIRQHRFADACGPLWGRVRQCRTLRTSAIKRPTQALGDPLWGRLPITR